VKIPLQKNQKKTFLLQHLPYMQSFTKPPEHKKYGISNRFALAMCHDCNLSTHRVKFFFGRFIDHEIQQIS